MRGKNTWIVKLFLNPFYLRDLLRMSYFINLKTKLYGPFSLMGFNCFKVTEPLWGRSLLFTTKFPEISATHVIDLGRMEWPPCSFEQGASGLGIQHQLLKYRICSVTKLINENSFIPKAELLRTKKKLY